MTDLIARLNQSAAAARQSADVCGRTDGMSSLVSVFLGIADRFDEAVAAFTERESPLPTVKGTQIAREFGAGVHADVIDHFKEQLLIVFLKRLGRKILIPLAEVDDTAQDDLAFSVIDNVFHFETRRKS